MVTQTELTQATPYSFDFLTTAQAHGWVMLAPFAWDEDSATLSRVCQLAGGAVVRLRMQGDSDNLPAAVRVGIDSAGPLASAEVVEVRQGVRRMLRLDENLDEFHHLHQRLDGFDLQLKPGGGRLLRCPTLFEDMVYTLCTTNISWSGTIRMVARLTEKLGSYFPGQESWRAFPTAEAIAKAGPEFLKQKTGLGYRSGYVWQLAHNVAEGRLDLNSLEDPGRSADDLYQAVRRLKGFGDYAASTILMLLGRYERLAIDSELRSFVTKKYFAGQPPTNEKEIRAIYEPWGRWRYLAYWFDTPPGK